MMDGEFRNRKQRLYALIIAGLIAFKVLVMILVLYFIYLALYR